MNFRSAGFLAQPRPPGRGRIFDAASPPGARQDFWRSHAPGSRQDFWRRHAAGALMKTESTTVLNVFCAQRPSMP